MTDAAGPSHPITIQQSSNVSRVQEIAQRVGEHQQAAAVAENQERFDRERSQVLTADPGGSGAEVRPDEKGKREWRWNRAKKRKKSGSKPVDEAAESSGLVDVII